MRKDRRQQPRQLVDDVLRLDRDDAAQRRPPLELDDERQHRIEPIGAVEPGDGIGEADVEALELMAAEAIEQRLLAGEPAIQRGPRHLGDRRHLGHRQLARS